MINLVQPSADPFQQLAILVHRSATTLSALLIDFEAQYFAQSAISDALCTMSLRRYARSAWGADIVGEAQFDGVVAVRRLLVGKV